jgi:hypothetical protein
MRAEKVAGMLNNFGYDFEFFIFNWIFSATWVFIVLIDFVAN